MGRATKAVRNACKCSRISIHALRGEGDNKPRLCDLYFSFISIHALRGEGDGDIRLYGETRQYFNPRPPWGGRPYRRLKGVYRPNISIHALRGEGDSSVSSSAMISCKFQSTPSVGRATCGCNADTHRNYNFNPRPPWGGRRFIAQYSPVAPSISIHALRGEGDFRFRLLSPHTFRFQSTPSVGRATALQCRYRFPACISIHALRGEGDVQSRVLRCAISISIHALRGEGDKRRNTHFKRRLAFQSTPSVGRATSFIITPSALLIFQSTPSVGRATPQSTTFRTLS